MISDGMTDDWTQLAAELNKAASRTARSIMRDQGTPNLVHDLAEALAQRFINLYGHNEHNPDGDVADEMDTTRVFMEAINRCLLDTLTELGAEAVMNGADWPGALPGEARRGTAGETVTLHRVAVSKFVAARFPVPYLRPPHKPWSAHQLPMVRTNLKG